MLETRKVDNNSQDTHMH